MRTQGWLTPQPLQWRLPHEDATEDDCSNATYYWERGDYPITKDKPCVLRRPKQ